MKSFGATEIKHGNFMPTFKIQGQLYHVVGSLLPGTNKEPTFLQIYFMENRELVCPHANGEISEKSVSMLHSQMKWQY